MESVKKGDLVKWNDPAIFELDEEDVEAQESRVYEVVSVNGEVVTIADEYGEAEVYLDELERA